MLVNTKYDKKISKSFFSGKEYLIVNLIPDLKKNEKKQVNDEVKGRLFTIFKKYVKS